LHFNPLFLKIPDPEPFGPLTAKPLNLQEQLQSFLPHSIKTLSSNSAKSPSKLENSKCDTRADQFKPFPVRQSAEVTEFLNEADQKSISSTVDLVLWKLSSEKFTRFKWDARLVMAFLNLWKVWVSDRLQSLDFDFPSCKAFMNGMELIESLPEENRKEFIDCVEQVFCHLKHYFNNRTDTDDNGEFRFCSTL